MYQKNKILVYIYKSMYEKYKTGHVLVKHECPGWQQSQIMAKISKFYILTLPHPRGMGC